MTTQENEVLFYCKECKYHAYKRSSWNKHIDTLKHNYNKTKHAKTINNTQQQQTTYNKQQTTYNNQQTTYTTEHKKDNIYIDEKHVNDNFLNSSKKTYECDCGKKYKYRQGLYVHRKKCHLYLQVCNTENNSNIISNVSMSSVNKNNNSTINSSNSENMFIHHHDSDFNKHMISELTTIVKELITNGIFKNTCNNTNNTNNVNSFNTINKNDINIFLSNECANAISIQDFVKQLVITIDDLNNTRHNTANGIAKIVENNLIPLTVTERPMHHIEQNEWYIKDKKKGWETDNGTRIVNETHKELQKKWSKVFTEQHPEWDKNEEDTTAFIELAHSTTSELNISEINSIKQKLSKQCLITDKVIKQ
jgi:hypothetical protein